MRRYGFIAPLLIMLVISACLPIVELAPTRTSPGDLPAGTQALPPAFTPTPSPPPTFTPAPTPDLPMLDQRLGLLPAYSNDVDKLDDVTRYWIEVELNFEEDAREATINGSTRIVFTNPLEQRLSDIVLMLWPNDDQYAAVMSAGPAVIEGRVVEGETVTQGLGLRFDLPRSLGPGESVDLSLPFRVEIEAMSALAPKRMGVTEGVLLAPTFYPLIPRLIDGEWELKDAPPGGDTTNSEVAFYQIDVTWPTAFKLVASGVEVNRHEVGEFAQATFISGPMRDVALALGPFLMESRQVGEVTLQAWILREHREDNEVVLDSAAVQLALLNELVGPYPYPELDLVDAPGAFGGIEYPGLVFLGTIGSNWVIEPTVHEVAHQWFYGLIGNNQITQPWLDEAVATYTEALYYEEAQGSGRGTSFLSDLRSIVRGRPDSDLPIGLAVGDYEDEFTYATIVYLKGALFFDALRGELGDSGFTAFLQTYYETYRYDVADANGFQEIAEATCGCDLNRLFDLWVYEGGTVLELE
jgi:hypothetical protein